MVIPEEFIIQKFYQHAGYPRYVKSTNTYMGGCPVCREGSSWGRKSRCYYIPKDTAICCHNCGWYGKPLNWVMEVEGIDFQQVVKQVEDCDYEYGIEDKIKDKKTYEIPTLPNDSINLFDSNQLNYYKDVPIVRKAAELTVTRRLNKAVNRPKALYVSLTDMVHKERLVIPFYNREKQCVRKGNEVQGGGVACTGQMER